MRRTITLTFLVLFWAASANPGRPYSPQVMSVSPAQNELNVLSNPDISVTFDIDMDQYTINDTTFIIHARSTGLHYGTINYDSQTKTAVFSPTEDFAVGEEVTVILTPQIKSLSGISLEQGYTWSFIIAVIGSEGVFETYSEFLIGKMPRSIIAADLNNDGYYDLVTANRSSNNISILFNNGDGYFAEYSEYLAGNEPHSVHAVDLDRDNDIDLAVANLVSDDITVFFNAGDGTFNEYLNIAVGEHPHSIFSADLDCDGNIDLVTANRNSNNASVVLNDGAGNFQEHKLYQVGDYPHSIFASDLDRDGDFDLAVANLSSNDISVLFNLGDASFGSQIRYPVDGTYPHSIFAADFNNDNAVDLSVANHSSANVSILLNNGDGTFGANSVYSVGDLPHTIIAADLNGDDYLDLATANRESRDVSILLNNGNNGFESEIRYSINGATIALVASDLDNDGDLDLATADYSDSVSVLFKKRGVLIDLTIEGETGILNVINHSPKFIWDFYGIASQTAFEIAVGTDSDWTIAEMWNPLVFYSADTFVTYDGMPLIDGETYFVHIRISDEIGWSGWYETSFRMNSIPSVPILLSPGGGKVVESNTPSLYLQNSTDAEGDLLTYDYFVYDDSEYVYAEVSGVEEQTDSTGWTVDIPMIDNMPYMWTARANDGYEYSEWSLVEWFWVNSIEDYPTPFDMILPPDTGWSQVYESPILFWWHESFDNDPFDSIYYRLLIAVDSDFTFVATYDSLYYTCCALPEFAILIELDYGTHYWWKVYAIDTKGNMTQSNGVADFMTWILGDANADFGVNVGDAVFLINYVFKSGESPDPLKIGDVNADCETNVGDAVYLINYVFRSGDPPKVGCAVK